MSRNKIALILSLTFLATASGAAEVLSWKANPGLKYEATVTVRESITDIGSETVKPEKTTETATLQETAAQNGSTIHYLRNLPAFPQTAVVPGDTWKDKATVLWDLSAFGIKEPVSVESIVQYRYVEDAEIDTRSYAHIQATWSPFWLPQPTTAKRSGIKRIIGSSTLDIYWDNKAGSPKRSVLTERIQYRFTEGSSLLQTRETVENIKTVTDIQREALVAELNKQLESQKVQNVAVKQSNEGIVLSLEKIQFEAESAVLAEAEKAKLKRIGAILTSLPGRKLNIVGHAAKPVGSVDAELLALSAQRAQSVTDFLVAEGIRKADEIVTSGRGGEVPIDSNSTADGRSRNRRVEITIMDEGVTQ